MTLMDAHCKMITLECAFSLTCIALLKLQYQNAQCDLLLLDNKYIMQMSLALLASLLKGLKLTLLPSAKLMFDYPKNVSVHLITLADECISSNLVST